MKSSKFLLLLVFFSIFLNPILSQEDAWERIIPTPQEHGLFCVRQIPGTDRIVAVGRGSTIMFSEDFGETWDIVLNPANLPNNATFLTVSFADENNGYAVAFDGKIIKTSDGGINWQIIFDKDLLYSYNYEAGIHTFHADTVIVGIENMVLKTTDGGIQWDTTIVNGLFVSSIDFVNENIGYITGGKSRILQTLDRGETWEWINIENPNDIYFSDIEFINDSVGFLAVNTGDISDSIYVYRSTNAGNDWKEVFKTPIGFNTGEIEFKDELNGCIRIYTWSYSFVYTEDGGDTWVWDEDGHWFSHKKDDSFLYCPDYLLGVGQFGRIAKSYAMEESWEEISYNWDAGNYVDIEFTSGQTGYAIYHIKNWGHGFMYKTKDGGKTWHKISVSNHIAQGSISFINNNNGFLLADLQLYKTNDGGENWTELYFFSEAEDYYEEPINLVFRDSLNGIATVGINAYKSDDGGMSWQLILISEAFWMDGFNSIEFLSRDSIFLTIDENSTAVYKSNDGGETFEKQLLGYENGLTKKVHFINQTTGFLLVNYVVSNGGLILKTIDGGDSWYETIVDDTNYIEYDDIYFSSEEVGYAVGGGHVNKAFKTLDGGETWNSINIDCTSELKEIHFFDDWHGLIFGDNGVVLETFSGGVVGLEENPFVNNKSNISVYPNPAQNKITIQLEEPLTNDVYLKLYNLQGKCLVRKYYTNSSLNQNISLDISDLPPGIYTCRVKSGKYFKTSKLVKL